MAWFRSDMIKGNMQLPRLPGSRFTVQGFNPDFIGKPLSMPRLINRLMKNMHLTVNGLANNH